MSLAQVTNCAFESAKIEGVKYLCECSFIGPYIEEIGPCKMALNQYGYFESLVKSIVSQQLSLKAAATIEGRLSTLLQDCYTPETLLQHSFEDLRNCGLSTRKAEYVQLLAQNSADKRIPYDKFDSMGAEQVIEVLVKQKGIGPWTAQMFLMWTMGRTDIFAPLDLGIQKGMFIVFQKQELSLQDMEKLSERWSPYRSIASWYLWRIQEQ